MAVTIEKLNDDTTFLLAFAPAFAPKAKLHRHFPGAYTLLLDPWLAGSSSLLHPTFQISHHTADCAIRSLADLDPPPDLILISQDKPDHCHRDTLCALPPHTTARILAVPAAAKKIRSWRHFDPDVVEVLRPYHPASHHTVLRIPLPAYTSTSSAGEITIANIATRRDLTALHNALAITYRPPGSLLSAVAPDPAEPRDRGPPPAPRSIAASIQGTVTGDPSPHLRRSKSAWTLKRSKSRVHVDHDQRPTTSHGQRARECSSPEPIWIDATGRQHQLPAPPPVPASSPSPTRDRSDSKLSFTSVTPRAHTHKEKTLSIIYTPHGISLSALRPYLDHHLHPITSAHLTPDHTGTDRLPVTALFHGLNTEQNPWFMGGLVSHGAPKGIELAKALRPRHWVSAHDEQKENRGLSVSWIKSRQYSAKAVQAMLEEGEVAGTDIGCSVKCMAVGEVFRVDG